MTSRTHAILAATAIFITSTLAEAQRPSNDAYSFTAEKLEATLLGMSLPEANLVSSPYLLRVIRSIEDSASDPSGKLDFLRSVCFYRQADNENSLIMVERALEANSDDAMYFWHRARTMVKAKRLDAADADCDAALSINPEFSSAVLLKAMISGQRGAPEVGYELLDDYGKAFDDQCFEQYLRGALCIEMQKLDESVSHFQKALHLVSPHFGISASSIWSAMAVAHNYNGDKNKAFAASLRAAECRKPGDQQLVPAILACREREYRLAAFSLADEFARRRPADIKPRELLLMTVVDLEQYDEAVKQSRKLLSLDPDNALANEVADKISQARSEGNKR